MGRTLRPSLASEPLTTRPWGATGRAGPAKTAVDAPAPQPVALRGALPRAGGGRRRGRPFGCGLLRRGLLRRLRGRPGGGRGRSGVRRVGHDGVDGPPAVPGGDGAVGPEGVAVDGQLLGGRLFGQAPGVGVALAYAEVTDRPHVEAAQ